MAASLSRNTDQPWSEAEYERLHTFTQIVAVVAEQIQSRVSNNVDYDLLSRERDNFRILVAITNAVLSRLDMDELVSEVSKEIHHYFKLTPSALPCAAIARASSTSTPRTISTKRTGP